MTMRRGEMLEGKSVLVTGGAGFVGSHLVDRIVQERPAELVVVDDFSLGDTSNLHDAIKVYPNMQVCDADISSYSRMDMLLRGLGRPDVVFNLAVSPLPESLSEPLLCVNHNVGIVTNLCECARRGLFKTLVHFSSSEAYGTMHDGLESLSEEVPHFPETPYAASKLAGDHIIFSYRRTFGIDALVVRPFNQYGPRQNAGRFAGIIPVVIGRLLRGEDIVVRGDGEQTRDFVYVSDTVDAVMELCTAVRIRAAWIEHPINVASGVDVSMNTIIGLLCEIAGKSPRIVHEDPRPGDVRRHIGSTRLLHSLIKSRPRIGIQEGLRMTYEWYRDLVQ